jgi:hypothetical protein
VVAFAVASAYSLLVIPVRPGTTASRLVLLTDVVIKHKAYAVALSYLAILIIGIPAGVPP